MRPRTPRPLVVDSLIALALTAVSVLLTEVSRAAEGWPEPDVLALVLIGVVNLSVALRGRWPVGVFVVGQVASAVYVSFGYWPVACVLGAMVALYTVAAHRSTRIAVACAAVKGAVWAYAGVVEHAPMVLNLGQAVVYSSVVVWFGMLSRRSAELSRRLRDMQAERARRVVAEERGRMARELHDVVAHHMSVISVQAGLARFVLDSDPEKTRGALGTIADASGEALGELRRMLRVLREEDPQLPEGAPIPTLARLGELVDRVRAAGVSVDLAVEGTPRPLAPGVELCAFRVVQEALTNVLKHAGQAHAHVELRYGRSELAVSVTDDGEGVIQGRVPTDAGHGLIGMRERAKLYGGTISLGPHAGGGFVVELVLPTTAPFARRGDDDSR
ncbi:sensor histidine kinase [Streptomyces sp. NBC_00986]|uniref:sensor histidine kinase n=1 Tax=Streptomyces sp. NBC_00986 TaxID=2903702 RepID=UPI00386621C6|nr:sensor histidine kinase [Streptomyces sp. NBC_00986]